LKANKISYEMLDTPLKSMLDKNMDTGLVRSYSDIPVVRSEFDKEAYIIVDDDMYFEGEEEKNRKGYIYYAKNISDSYVYVGRQKSIEFTPYDLAENNPFAFKNHTHDLSGEDYTISWDNVLNKPESWHPGRHTHVSGEVDISWADISRKPEVFPPAEHTHGSSGGIGETWEDISGRPGLFGVNLIHNPGFKIHQRYKDDDFFKDIESNGESVIVFDRWQCINELDITAQVKKSEDGGIKVTAADESYGYFTLRQRLSSKEIGYSAGVIRKNYTLSINADLQNVYSLGLFVNNIKVGDLKTEKKVSFPFDIFVFKDYVNIDLKVSPLSGSPVDFTVYSIKLEEGDVATNYIDTSESMELLRCKRYYQRLMLPQNIIQSFENNQIRLMYPGYIQMVQTPDVKLLNDLYIHKSDGSSNIKIALKDENITSLTNVLFKDSCVIIDTYDKVYLIPDKTQYIANSHSSKLIYDENEIELSVGY